MPSPGCPCFPQDRSCGPCFCGCGWCGKQRRVTMMSAGNYVRAGKGRKPCVGGFEPRCPPIFGPYPWWPVKEPPAPPQPPPWFPPWWPPAGQPGDAGATPGGGAATFPGAVVGPGGATYTAPPGKPTTTGPTGIGAIVRAALGLP